ncbi:MAG: di-trans,poly-cis-decaprenylcistransferase [Clostridia bacterium]|nr:di-trans,poly-cis-decaprenylcistransferase [Clostridia bacterium]
MKKTKKEFKVDERLKHIAFIMDGNGRWAKKRMLPRSVGHSFGVKSMEKTLNSCFKMGIEAVTVYAFSTENWTRPKQEVDSIIKLLREYIVDAKKHENVRYVFLGDKSILDEDLRNEMLKLEQDTKCLKNLLNIAFNYGGRAEIVKACNSLIENGLPITEEGISKNLYTSHVQDPDLIVRTGGEYRLSNFLMWQSAYSEIYVTDVLWPDFNEEELIKAIESFYRRKRRFGGLNKDEE